MNCLCSLEGKSAVVTGAAMGIGFTVVVAKWGSQTVSRVVPRVQETRRKMIQAEQLRRRNEAYLHQLASEYARTRRTDDQAIEVFERLADDPHCEARWLQNLAMIYVVRQMWGRLKALAEKVEARNKNK